MNLKIKNRINFEEVASSLSDVLTTMNLEEIESAFKDFFWGIQDCEYIFYSVKDTDKHIKFLKEKFLEEYYIYPHYIASKLNLELVNA
jgi:hypothetical protein